MRTETFVIPVANAESEAVAIPVKTGPFVKCDWPCKCCYPELYAANAKHIEPVQRRRGWEMFTPTDEKV